MLNPPRIALIGFHTCPFTSLGTGKAGGMNVYIRQMARHLGQLGFQVDIFTRRHPGNEPQVMELRDGARVIHLDGGPEQPRLPRYYPWLPRFLDELCRFQESHGLRYELLHAHYWLSGWVGMVLSRRWGVPLVSTFHTLAETKRRARPGEEEPALRSRLERRVIEASQGIIAFSRHEKEAIVRFYQAPPQKIAVIPCGVDLSHFKPLSQATARDELGLNGHKVLLFVGRLEPIKGVELLLRTAAIMKDWEKLRVLIIGGAVEQGREVERLRSLSAMLGIQSLVQFIGTVRHEELPLYYNAADVCVIPSFYESFSFAALEAMACGVPVVAARVGGLSTLVQHSRTGYLVAGHCPEPYVNCLEALLASQALRRAMGQQARAWAEGLGWEQVSARVAALSQDLLTSASKRP
ncbi:MAG: glycosyltransferase [Dehalococcoidia bacterium]